MAKIKSVIGIEMDAGAIRAVELSKSGDGNVVSAFAKVPIETGIVEEGFVRDTDKFYAILTEMMDKGGFKTQDIVVGVNNENVIMRYASFPKVSDDKLRKMVLLQAQDFIPIPVAEMEIDYVVSGAGKDDDDQAVLNVLLVAARRSMLESLITLFSASKLKVYDIDSSVLAWCRAALKYSEHKTLGVLKLSDDVINFVALDDNEIKMVRSLNVPERIAYTVKNVFCNPESSSDEDYSLIASMLSNELSSSISYYQMQGYAPIETVYFSALMEGENIVAQKLKEMAFVPVEVPMFCSEYETSNFAPAEYTGCISLALEALEG